MKNILKMLPYIRDQYGRIAVIIFASLIIAGLSALQPQLFKNIVDTVVARGNELEWADVARNFWFLVVLSIVSIIASFIFNIASQRTMYAVSSHLYRKVFTAITNLSIDYFETNRPGALIQKCSLAVRSFSGWINHLNYSLLGPIFTMIVVTVILFYTQVIIGFLGLAIIIVSSLEYWFTRTRAKPDNVRWRKHDETSRAIFTETIHNISTIATLSSLKRFQTQLDREEDKALFFVYRVRDRWQRSNFRVSLFNELAFLLAVGLIIYELIQNRLSAGTFVAITIYFTSLRNNARVFSQFIPDTDQTERDVERLVEVLETKPTFPDAPDAVELDHLKSLEFRNVSFTYPDGKKGAVENISFILKDTRSIALVGPSGVGKSTITKLMLRFYAPTAGSILINGEPAEHFTHESVRARIGMVMQDVALFNTTVKENLKLARAQARTADLIAAAEQAHAAEFIDELPKQYNTLVGERGVKLSGGQKQRIAIARAILKDPDLIILDEATSALDSVSERLVQAGLKELSTGRLGLTIAHRLSTVRHADEILVLKKGSIAERGTHAELMKKPKGLYRRLFELQSATGKIKL